MRVKCIRMNLSLPLLSQYIGFSALDSQSRNSKNKVPRIRFCGPIKSSKNNLLVNTGKASKALRNVCSEDVEGVLVWMRRGDGWERRDAQTGKSSGESFHGIGRVECAAINKLEGRALWDLKERFADCCLCGDAKRASQHTTGGVRRWNMTLRVARKLSVDPTQIRCTTLCSYPRWTIHLTSHISVRTVLLYRKTRHQPNHPTREPTSSTELNLNIITPNRVQSTKCTPLFKNPRYSTTESHATFTASISSARCSATVPTGHSLPILV